MSADTILAESFAKLREGDPLAAETLLSELWNAGPKPPSKAVHLLGLIRRAQKRYAEAEELIRTSIAAEPQNYEYHNNLGNLLLAVGLAPEAAKAYRDALRVAPGFEQARVSLVRALVAEGDHKGAEREARGIVTAKRSAETLGLLATTLRVQRRYDESLAALEEALRMKPGQRELRHAYGLTLDRMERYDEAIAIYAALGREGLNAPDLFLNWGWALVAVGKGEEGEARLSEGLRHQPDPRLHAQLATLRWMRGDGPTRFARDLEQAVRAAPDNASLRVLAADMLRRADRVKDAETMLRDGVAENSEIAPLWAALGALLDDENKLKEAVEAYRLAAGLAPGDANVLGEFVHVLLRAGDVPFARQVLAEARKLRPTDQLLLAHEATAARMAGEPGYQRLYDYRRFVHVVDLQPPAGYASMEEFNAALAQSLEARHRFAAHPIDQTLRGGTQTDRSLIDARDPVIVAFFESAAAAVRGFVQGLPNDATHPFLARKSGGGVFDDAWSVRLKAGGHHVNHVHPRGWISSAYYVRVPKAQAGDDAHAGWLKLGEPRLPIKNCTPEYWVEPKPGRLVLFPSYMWHGTAPFAREDRLTIAFDVIPA